MYYFLCCYFWHFKNIFCGAAFLECLVPALAEVAALPVGSANASM